MKMFLDLVRPGRRPLNRWAARLALGLAISFFAAGCGKKSDTSASNTTALQTTGATAATPGATNSTPDLRPLNQALLQWRLANRRVPSSFEEFAASANINIPPPPPGKKYVINSSGLISLVNAN